MEEISSSQGQEENAAEFSLPRNFATYIFPELVWEIGGELILHDFLDMEPLQKAWAIYEWCYSNIRNAADAVKDDMLQAVYDGLHYKVGDCYTYFATSSYLLSICGIENLAVSRKSENATHYWSLVNMDGGWYHFDCSHLPEHYQCFMQTDAQVQEYSEKVRGQGGYYQFDQENMPERATAIIYSGER